MGEIKMKFKKTKTTKKDTMGKIKHKKTEIDGQIYHAFELEESNSQNDNTT